MIQGRQWGILNCYRLHSKGHTKPLPPKTVPNWNFQSVHRETIPTVITTSLKETNVFLLCSSLTFLNPLVLYKSILLIFCCWNIVFLVLKVWNNLQFVIYRVFVVRRLFMQIKYCLDEWFLTLWICFDKYYISENSKNKKAKKKISNGTHRRFTRSRRTTIAGTIQWPG